MVPFRVTFDVTGATVTALVKRRGEWREETTNVDAARITPDGRLELRATKDSIVQSVRLHLGTAGHTDVTLDRDVRVRRGDTVTIDVSNITLWQTG